MILLLVILFTSLAGFVLTWLVTGGFDPANGNAAAAVLAAIAIALLWSRGFMTLERDYLKGRFDRVRRKLLLWGASLGVEEVALLRLFMAVEGREQEEIDRCLATAAPLGLTVATKAWVFGATARLQGDASKAAAVFAAGAEAAKGLDRAELLCEAGVVLLQARTGLAVDIRRDELQRAIQYSNEVDQLLRSMRPTRGQTNRFRYVSAFHQMLRGMIYLAQGRGDDAIQRLNDTASSARLLASLRARRLAVLCRVEMLPALRRAEGENGYQEAIASVQKSTTLPLLRLRLAEIEEQMMRPQAPKVRPGDGRFLFTPQATRVAEAPAYPEPVNENPEVLDTASFLLGEPPPEEDAEAESLPVDEPPVADPGSPGDTGPEPETDGDDTPLPATIEDDDDEDDLIPAPADEDGQLRFEIPDRSSDEDGRA